jgi:hypothetical protein
MVVPMQTSPSCASCGDEERPQELFPRRLLHRLHLRRRPQWVMQYRRQGWWKGWLNDWNAYTAENCYVLDKLAETSYEIALHRVTYSRTPAARINICSGVSVR